MPADDASMRRTERRSARAGDRPPVGRVRPAVLAALALTTALYVALLLPHDEDWSLPVDGVLGNLVLLLPTVACLGRAVLVPAQRLAFLLIGLAGASFTAGNLVYVFHVQFLDPVPYPSVADIGYLAPYPLLLAAIVALAVRELRDLPQGVLLDGLLGGLTVAAAGSILTVAPLVQDLGDDLLTRVAGAAYPVADLTLVAAIVAVVTMKGGRPGRTWLWLGSGAVVFGVADTIYLYRLTADSYTIGTPLDALWALGLNLMGVAAVLTYDPGDRRRSGTSERALLLPSAFNVCAVAVLAYGSLVAHPLPPYAVILTLLTLATAVRRTAVGFGALRRLAKIEQLARTDELTQLPNRRYFEELAQQRLAGRGPGDRLAVIALDLDDFAAVNATSGHHAGDELLRQIGPRLRAELREDDLVARLGGDEFGLLVPVADREEAMSVAERVAEVVTRPFLVDGARRSTSACLGVALCPDDGLDLAVLLQRSDAALTDAKRNALGLVSYDATRHGRGHDRLDLRQGIEGGQLVTHYQPQFDLATGRMCGAEALVRWQHPERGLLYPDVFLPFAEQDGLMPELTLEVLELGARDWRRWHLDGRTLELSVNLAPSALLRDDLIDRITGVLTRHGMPAHALVLEITENVLLVDSVRSLRTLTGLRSLGIQLSLDDYGTGYCSLTYLRDLPLHEVKIDRSFVMTLEAGSTDAAIVASTVSLAKALGLRTVAEGVETPVGLETLRTLGCDVVQGYLLGRPMPAEKIARLPQPGPLRRPLAAGQT